jgi:hypothetical protein
VEKQKEVQKLNFFNYCLLKKWRKEKNLCRAPEIKSTAKTNGRLLQKWRKEKNLCRAPEIKTHGKESLSYVRE